MFTVRDKMKLLLIVSALCLAVPSASFTIQSPAQFVQLSAVTTTTTTALFAAQGFGSKPTKREKSEGQVKREKESAKYEELTAQGGQEYSIWTRQFGTGGDTGDKGWVPCGAIAVPRGAQVSDAIFSNESALKSAITRSYPKLKGLEDELEFGYNLKVYPDDPIETAQKNGPRATGLSVGNWINTLLSPIDASKVPPPPIASTDSE